MPRPSHLVAATAAVLLLGACAGSPSADHAASTATAAPATAVRAVPVAPGEEPPFAFAGDCNAMVTEAEIDGLVGADVTRIADEAGGSVSPVDVLGGLTCGWGGGDYAFTVVVTVIPSEGLEDRIAAFSSPGGLECWGQDETGTGGACYFDRIVAGYWLAGMFQVESGAGLRPTDSIDALAALVEQRADEYPATPLELPAATWPPMDCSSLAAGAAPSTDGAGAVSGTMLAGFAGPGPVAAEAILGGERCVWSDPHGFTTELTPGAGWAMARLTDGAPIEVDGATAAVLHRQSDGDERITATDGVNLAWITVPETSSSADAAAFLAIVMRAAD